MKKRKPIQESLPNMKKKGRIYKTSMKGRWNLIEKKEKFQL